MNTMTSLPTAMAPESMGLAVISHDAPTMPAGSAELPAPGVRATYHRGRGAFDWGTLMNYLTTGVDAGDWKARTSTDLAMNGLTPQRRSSLADLATDSTVALAVTVAERSGVPLTLGESGQPAPLAADVELLARQILRYGLAQAVAAAGVDGRVVVRMIWGETTCELRIHTFEGNGAANTGRDPAITHDRLAERVKAAGGRYVATPTAAGYLAGAVLPLSAALALYAEPAPRAEPAPYAEPTPQAEAA